MSDRKDCPHAVPLEIAFTFSYDPSTFSHSLTTRMDDLHLEEIYVSIRCIVVLYDNHDIDNLYIFHCDSDDRNDNYNGKNHHHQSSCSTVLTILIIGLNILMN